MDYEIVCDDILNWCAGYEGEKFHAALLDPPYHLKGGFMSKAWDKDGPDAIAFQPETWAAIAEHLYPGAFLMAFGGSRTFHRVAVAMEDAGLILHPTLVHLQAQGFPKASRIDTAIDKAAGAEREVVGVQPIGRNGGHQQFNGENTRPWQERNRQAGHGGEITAPATPLAATWAGHRYGLQALKPCAEFILCAQKPYAGRPVESIVATGAGALWIDGARVACNDHPGIHKSFSNGVHDGWDRPWRDNGPPEYHETPQGRWPPNVTLSHIPPHPCPACDGDGCPDCGDGWLEGCRRVGTKRVRRTDKKGGRDHPPSQFVSGNDYERLMHGDPDGTEVVDDWLCVDGCPVRELGEMSANGRASKPSRTGSDKGGGIWRQGKPREVQQYDDSQGNAARFYPQSDWRYEIEERLAGVTPFMYQAKAAKRERNAGLSRFVWKRDGGDHRRIQSDRAIDEFWRWQEFGLPGKGFDDWLLNAEGKTRKISKIPYTRGNIHPTQKPIALCKWLAALILPPVEYAPRRLLIPFFGKGSEGAGAILAGWDGIVGIEQDPNYCEAGEARLRFWAGWSERGHDEPKEILKQAAKEKKKQPEPQLELEL